MKHIIENIYKELLEHVGSSKSFDEIAHTLVESYVDVFLIGNGGSAAVADHGAVDLTNAGVSAMSLVHGPTLTCMANDNDYSRCFSEILPIRASSLDVLFAISSSGESENIVRAVEVARSLGMSVITMTGFSPMNSLVMVPDTTQIYVDSFRYDVVETAHTAVLHEIARLCRRYNGKAGSVYEICSIQ